MLWEMSLNLDSPPVQMINSMRKGKTELSFPTHVPAVKSQETTLAKQKRIEEGKWNTVKGIASVECEPEGEAIRLRNQKIVEPKDWTFVLLDSFIFQERLFWKKTHSSLKIFSSI